MSTADALLTAEDTLKTATGRKDATDALAWIAEGRACSPSVPTYRLIQALITIADASPGVSGEALRKVVRRATSSALDTSADLLNVNSVRRPSEYEDALRMLSSFTPTGSLADLTIDALSVAVTRNDLVVESLGLVAALSWRDLRERAAQRRVTLPGRSDGQWDLSQLQVVLDIVDEIVKGTATPGLPGATVARPIELLAPDESHGWEAIQHYLDGGVSYGTLLAQRDVGSAWGAHRNRTSSAVSGVVTEQILQELTKAGIAYWSTEGKGEPTVSRAVLSRYAAGEGSAPGQLTVVTRTIKGEPALAVLVAAARDGGTARKTSATLLPVPEQLLVPAAVVLVGAGWSNRGETDALVRAFDGRVFTESRINELAALSQEAAEVVGPA